MMMMMTMIMKSNRRNNSNLAVAVQWPEKARGKRGGREKKEGELDAILPLSLARGRT